MSLATYESFLKMHEKLIIVVIGAALLFYVSDRSINAWVARDKPASTAAAVVVKNDDAATLALQQQVQTLTAQLTAQNAAAQVAVKKRQQTDATLTQAQLAARIAALVNVPQQEILPSPTAGMTLTEPAAVAVAQQLELVPALQTELANDNTIIAKQNDLIIQLTQDVKDVKLKDEDDIKTLTAEKKKSWINGFKYGFVAGITLGLVVKH